MFRQRENTQRKKLKIWKLPHLEVKNPLKKACTIEYSLRLFTCLKTFFIFPLCTYIMYVCKYSIPATIHTCITGNMTKRRSSPIFFSLSYTSSIPHIYKLIFSTIREKTRVFFMSQILLFVYMYIG